MDLKLGAKNMSSELDPRIMKTKQQLKRALIKLLSKQSTQSLSIQQITETAEITRGTFYLHYHDKQDFIQTIVNDFVTDFFQCALVDAKSSLNEKMVVSEHTVHAFSLGKGFKYMADNYQVFMVLFGLVGENNFTEKIKLGFHHYLDTFFKSLELKENLQLANIKVEADFVIAGLLGIMQEWLSGGGVYSPRFVSNKMYNLIRTKSTAVVGVSDFFVK